MLYIKRRKLLFGVLIILALVAMACASATPTEPEVEGPSGKITVWAWDLPDDAFASCIPGFQAKYPDNPIEVEVVSVPWSDIHTKLATAIEAGSGAPDLSIVEGYFMPTFAGPGVVDLTDKVEPYRDRIAPAKFVEVESDGRVWGVPWDLPPAVLLYREDLFEEAGITEIPKTWDEYVNVLGPKLAENGHFLMAIDPSTATAFYWYRALLAQIGSGYFDENGDVLLGDEKSVRVAQWMADAIDKGDALTGVQYFEGPSWWSALKDNKVASMVGATWMVGMMKDQVPEQAGLWRAAPLPVFEEDDPPVTYLGGSSVIIPSQSTNQETAWAFVEYCLLTVEGNKAIFDATNVWPGYLPMFADEAFDTPDPYFGGQAIGRIFADLNPQVGPYYYTEKMDQAETIVNDHLFLILTGAEDAESGIKAAAEEIKALN
jgi:lactose/L-arabinose transport system substrate-binding protein